MSTRYNNGSHYENHQRAAELQDSAEHAHRVAEQEHSKEEHLTAHEQTRQAHEHSSRPNAATETNGHASSGHGVETFGHAEIAALAHELWQQRGCPEGSPEEDWYRAAQQLRSRMPVH